MTLVVKSLPANAGDVRDAKRMGFPGSSAGKEFACNAGDPGSIPELGRSPREEIGYPFQYSCPENPHGQGSLVGYRPWGHKGHD